MMYGAHTYAMIDGAVMEKSTMVSTYNMYDIIINIGNITGDRWQNAIRQIYPPSNMYDRDSERTAKGIIKKSLAMARVILRWANGVIRVCVNLDVHKHTHTHTNRS